jgi:hypothetical protein
MNCLFEAPPFNSSTKETEWQERHLAELNRAQPIGDHIQVEMGFLLMLIRVRLTSQIKWCISRRSAVEPIIGRLREDLLFIQALRLVQIYLQVEGFEYLSDGSMVAP